MTNGELEKHQRGSNFEVIVFFLQFVPIVWYDVYFEKQNPPTYRPIGEMEGRVRETNIFLRMAQSINQSYNSYLF